VKTRTVWEADDGSRWDDAAAARKRDDLIKEVDAAMRPLGKRHRGKGCDFENGGGYVQHKPSAVAEARANLLVPTRRVLAWWFEDQMKRFKKDPSGADPSWFCRMLDGGHAPLDRAWSRLMCIDAKGREWGQPYYATHPDAATQVEIRAVEAESLR